MKNILIICRKELKSYFASPIAYLLMAIFALIFGFFFYSATRFFVMQALQAQMMGRGMPPMDVNEWVIRPLLSTPAWSALFLIPMITMRLFAEEKRSGTIELLMTSPVHDVEIILGKWLAAMVMYAVRHRRSPALESGCCFLRQAGLEADPGRLSRPAAAGRRLLAIGTFISTTTRNQIIAGGATFAVCLLLWVLDWVSSYETRELGKGDCVLSVVTHFEPFSKGVIDIEGRGLLRFHDFPGLFLTARSLESLRWRARCNHELDESPANEIRRCTSRSICW